MRPRLRPHVQITRQFYRKRRWHIAHDPTSNQFYRLSPVGFDFVSTLDGGRTVEEAWKLSLSKFGDSAPTQHEVLELIGQLYTSNLLSVDATPEVEQLLGRGRERTKKRIASQAVSLMYFKLRLFNPDAILTALEPIFRPVLNRLGLLAWAAFLAYTLYCIIPQWSRLKAGTDTVTAPGNWLWIMATYVALKLWHELGHGLIAKRCGGQVPEMGAMLLVLLPSPYVDASSAWSFPNKWHRIAVGGGGMMFELFAAACAAHVWLNTNSGDLINQIAYFVMITSSVTTVLFNANPLMRFDGYYMLSDWLEIPNLMQRSGQMLKSTIQKRVLRLENVRPVTTQPVEGFILFVYGILSMLYRLTVFFSIMLWLMGQWFGLGVVLAAWSFAAWFIIPVGTLIHWLASSAQLTEHRGRTVLATLGLILAGLALVGLVPVPDWRRATGVVDAVSRRGVYASTEGFVQTAHVRPGQKVAKGDAILTLISPDLASRKMQAEAEASELRVRLRDARNQDSPAAEQILQRQLEVARQTTEDLERREAELVIRAPIDGVIVSGDPARYTGVYIKRGEGVCEVVDPAHLRVEAVLAQGDADWMFHLRDSDYRVQMRRVSDVGSVIEGGRATIVPAGGRQLPHGALGYAGGGKIEVNDRDPTGRSAKNEQFSVFIEPVEGSLVDALPGERVYLRFTLPSKPVMGQVLDRVRKTLQGRVNL